MLLATALLSHGLHSADRPTAWHRHPYSARHRPLLAAAQLQSEHPLKEGARTTTTWRLREDWALEDHAASFTIGDEHACVTFWDSLVAAHPILRQRSPEELHQRATYLKCRVGCSPTPLLSAKRKADGTWTGRIDGHTACVNVEKEGALFSGDAYIESVSGKIYALEPVSMSVLQTADATIDMDAGALSTARAGGAVPPESALSEEAVRAHTAANLFVKLYLSTLAVSALLILGQLASLGIHAAATPDALAAPTIAGASLNLPVA